MSEPDPKNPHPVDVHVGGKIRARRREIAMSQHELAERVGVTFQQVQKYERSGNRISASRLFDVAQALDVPVSHFFLGIDGPEATYATELEAKVAAILSLAEGREMIDIFPQLGDASVRRKVVDLVRAISSMPPEKKDQA